MLNRHTNQAWYLTQSKTQSPVGQTKDLLPPTRRMNKTDTCQLEGRPTLRYRLVIKQKLSEGILQVSRLGVALSSMLCSQASVTETCKMPVRSLDKWETGNWGRRDTCSPSSPARKHLLLTEQAERHIEHVLAAPENQPSSWLSENMLLSACLLLHKPISFAL